MTATIRRNNAAKIQLFRELFAGSEDVYTTYEPQSGRYRQVKEPVTDAVIYSHLIGKRPYSVYLLTGERTRAVVADFDQSDVNLPREFVTKAAHYGLPAYIERSKTKGHHVWVFFERGGVLAAKARRVLRQILNDVGAPPAEIFPKQDAIRQGADFHGNPINAPLFGRLVPLARTVFLDAGMQPYANQWDLLAEVQRVSEQTLDDIIEINGLADHETSASSSAMDLGVFRAALIGLPPCARRMLLHGVSEYQRVACFRLALQLKRLGLPRELVSAALLAWSLRNRPAHGKRVITAQEIEAQTACAFSKAKYHGFGCEEAAVAPYCDPNCPVYAQTARAQAEANCRSGEDAPPDRSENEPIASESREQDEVQPMPTDNKDSNT